MCLPIPQGTSLPASGSVTWAYREMQLSSYKIFQGTRRRKRVYPCAPDEADQGDQGAHGVVMHVRLKFSKLNEAAASVSEGECEDECGSDGGSLHASVAGRRYMPAVHSTPNVPSEWGGFNRTGMVLS